MIELRIDSKKISVSDVFIKNQNSLLVYDEITFFNLITEFINVIIEKNPFTKIYFGNKAIDSKNCVFINLVDYSSIFNQLVLKKGSLLFEYILNKMNIIAESKLYELNTLLNDQFNEKNIQTSFDYLVDFDIDISKLVTTFGNLELDLEIQTFDKAILDLVKKFASINPNKTLIIFQNKNLIQSNLNLGNNTYTFVINDSAEPNVMITNEVLNFDKEIILSYLKMMWPVEAKKQELSEYLSKYIGTIVKNKENRTTDYNLFIINNIFCKVQNIKHHLTFDVDLNDLPIEIQNYINKDL